MRNLGLMIFSFNIEHKRRLVKFCVVFQSSVNQNQIKPEVLTNDSSL